MILLTEDLELIKQLLKYSTFVAVVHICFVTTSIFENTQKVLRPLSWNTQTFFHEKKNKTYYCIKFRIPFVDFLGFQGLI